MRELIDAMEDNWSKWQTSEGIKNLPEIRRPEQDALSSRSNASAWPIRWIVVGWVPSRNETQPGGSGSETFCSAIRCWKAISASGRA